jgi:hypothetical protein
VCGIEYNIPQYDGDSMINIVHYSNDKLHRIERMFICPIYYDKLGNGTGL